MKNGDKTAFAYGNPEQGGDIGLTKLEYAAIHIMAGLAMNEMVNHSKTELVGAAISTADALLSELAKGETG